MDLNDVAREMTTYMQQMSDTGLCHLRGGNCAMRIGPNRLAVTRTRTAKEKLTADHLLELPINSTDPVPEASVNLQLHRLIFQKTDADVVLHGHPYHAALLSYFTEEIRPIDDNGFMYLGSRIQVIAQPGLRQWSAIYEKLSDALTQAPVVVLRWHGSYAIAENFARAYHLTQAIDTSARFIMDVKEKSERFGPPTLPHYI